MTQEANEVLKRALTLPPNDRAELAGTLIESLDAGQDRDAEAAWNEEIARRIHDLDSGVAEAIPWAEVRRRIAAKLDNGR
jgi:putative addiction module component (TIGR02574 family)